MDGNAIVPPGVRVEVARPVIGSQDADDRHVDPLALRNMRRVHSGMLATKL